MEAYLTKQINHFMKISTSETSVYHPTTTSNREAPECSSPWTYCDMETYKCGEDIPQNSDIKFFQCHLDKSSIIQKGYCITYDDLAQINEMGSCIYSSIIDAATEN